MIHHSREFYPPSAKKQNISQLTLMSVGATYQVARV